MEQLPPNPMLPTLKAQSQKFLPRSAFNVRSYLLRKVHKPDHPWTFVVFKIEDPCYKISSWIEENQIVLWDHIMLETHIHLEHSLVFVDIKKHVCRLTNATCKLIFGKAKRYCIYCLDEPWMCWHLRFKKRCWLSWCNNSYHYEMSKEAKIIHAQLMQKFVMKVYRMIHAQTNKLKFELLTRLFNWSD